MGVPGLYSLGAGDAVQKEDSVVKFFDRCHVGSRQAGVCGQPDRIGAFFSAFSSAWKAGLGWNSASNGNGRRDGSRGGSGWPALNPGVSHV